MVCDLPVPGGPCTVKLRPARTSWMTHACEASASTTCRMSAGSALSSASSSRASGGSAGVSGANPPPEDPGISGCVSSVLSGQLVAIEIAQHQQFGEGKEAELNPVPVYFPAWLA